MGTKSAPASLAAIKGLDTIPDLSSQLQRAIELCDHPARAEMILKWLTEKCNKTPEIRSSLAFWDLLSRATRLFNVEKLAASLAPLSPINIIPLALVDAAGSPERLAQIGSFCELLHQVSNAPEGDVLKAVFVTDAEAASRFMGACLAGAIACLGGHESMSDDIASAESLVSFAALVWELHKSIPEDDTTFSKHCLVSAARLHSKLSPSLSKLASSGKRTHRGVDQTLSPDTTVAALIARHVFIPARSAFFKAGPGKSDTAVLEGRLENLDQLDADVCSALFDVCCRSISLNTHKSKLREQPWVETVFDALLAKCNTDDQLPCVQQLLAVVEKRATMSTDRLIKISETHAFSPDRDLPDFDLVARIIRLDGDVYVEDARAARLFEKIASSFQDGNDAAERARLVAEQVLIPVMQAFARHRNLTKFIDLWSQRLQEDSSCGRYFDWARIAGDFSDLIDTSLSATKATELVRVNCEAVHGIAEDGKRGMSNNESRSAFAASVVVLHGLLIGIRDEQVLDSVSPVLQTLFTDLLGLVPHIAEQEWEKNNHLQHVWPTLTKSLDIWFPRWSCQQREESITQELQTIVGSKGFRAAKKLVKSQSKNSALAQFIAAVLVYAPVEVAQDKDAEAISKPAIKGAKAATEAFIVKPKLFSLCSDVLPATMTAGLRGAWVNEEQEELAAPLVSAAISQSPVEATETVLEAVCAAAEASTEDSTTETSKRVLLSLRLLAELSPQLASAKRRRTVVNHLFQIEIPEDANDTKLYEEIEHRRLAALIQWVPLTNIDLEASPKDRCAMFWRLVERRYAGDNQQAYLKLLEAALTAISARIYAAESKSSEKGLQAEMTHKLETSIRKMTKSKTKNLSSGLAIAMRVAISGLENYKLPGQASLSPSTTAQYVKHLLEVVQHGLESSEHALQTSTALGNLTQLPKQMLEDCGMEIETFQLQCRHYISQLFDVEQLPSGAGLEAHVAGFKMACVCSLYATEATKLIDMGTKLLQSRPQPDQLVSVLSHFRDFVRKEVSFGARLELVQSLLENDSEGIRLAHETIATLQKTELDDIGHVPQQHILHSLAKLAADPSKQEISRLSLACIITILRGKQFLVNQYSLEATLSTLTSIVRDPSARQAHIIAAHRVFVVILQQHRARIQDRLNLVVCVLQASLNRLFESSPTTKEQGAVHGQMLARILQLLCDPPSTRQPTHGSDLVDGGRKTRAAVGRNVQHVLHQYCALVLASSNPGVTESLRPGLWAMIAAMEVNSEEAVKVLSAAMNNSERAVLRGVYEEYQRSAKWKGG